MSLVDWMKQSRERLIQRQGLKPVVFHHVPKCGGTSIGRALRKRYILSQVGLLVKPAFEMADTLYAKSEVEEAWPVVCDFREQFLVYQMHAGTRCVSAHIVFSRRAYDAFNQQYTFMTVLREPVARFLSHYHYTYAKRAGMSLASFLDTDEARNLGVRYVEYFHGMSERIDLFSSHALQQAQKNIECFDILGILEEPAHLVEDIEKVLGFTPKIGHDNKRQPVKSGGDKQAPPSPAEVEQIKKLCAPDIAIYQRALAINSSKRSS